MIRLWYGPTQVFGTPGLPQKWVNVLGRVESPAAALRARLGRGPWFPVALGPDGRRLIEPGDFNVELDSDTLRARSNRLTLEARGTDGIVERSEVRLRLDLWRTWPIPWSWDPRSWDPSGSGEGGPQVVDGLWGSNADGLRTTRPGYDRVLAFGDRLWRDYEVTARVTIHRFDRSVIGDPVQAGPALMLVLRWAGHTEREGFRPRVGWYPYGVTVCYGWYPELGRFGLSLQGNDAGAKPHPADRILAVDQADTALREGCTYDIRAFARSQPGAATLYGARVWESGTPEPDTWALTASGLPDELRAGSCLFVAHNTDVTVHTLEVLP